MPGSGNIRGAIQNNNTDMKLPWRISSMEECKNYHYSSVHRQEHLDFGSVMHLKLLHKLRHPDAISSMFTKSHCGNGRMDQLRSRLDRTGKI